MRASTLFALTLAILIGLGVAIAAKMSGYFNAPPPPTPEPVAKRPEIQVLVAQRNLFAGDLIDTSAARVRVLRADELEHYEKHKDQYLPAVVQAVYLRVADKHILADQPILKDALKEMAKPEPLLARLMPQMRAVSLSVTKEQSAGGLIQTGDWVDLLLTSIVENDQGQKTTRTACVVPRVRVVAKRNSLWPIFAPLPEEKPVQFTLEVNPYRAALMEFGRSKGQLTLALLPGSESRRLEAQRAQALQQSDLTLLPVHFLQAGSPEANEEDGRVDSFNRGQLAISEGDLVRLFGLTTPPPPPANITIERVNGVTHDAPSVFSPAGKLISTDNPRHAAAIRAAQQSSTIASPTFRFSAPDCPTCGTKKGASKAR